jgi:hypothetical protein
MGAALRRWAREPLLHFLVAGTALFALWYGRGDPAAKRERIVVTAATIDVLAENWTRLRLRPPTAEELSGLVEDHIREEIFYREALALGLDREDTIIRRRLRQKLEFVSEDLASQAQPTEQQLQQYLAEHADAFRADPRFTFTHVFLSPKRRGAALDGDAAGLLAELNRPGGSKDAQEGGDPFLLPFDFEAAGSAEVAAMFGDEFATALATLETGAWRGPIRSGYGAHLVLVRDRLPGRAPALAEVREAVRREWETRARRESNEAFYRRLRSRYAVSVERRQLTASAPDAR